MAKNRAEEKTINLENAQHSDNSKNNQMRIFGALVLLLLLVGAYFVYKIAYQEPRQQEAMANSSRAQFQFDRDSFQLALNNPGNEMPGFLDIIEDYSGSDAANTAKFYAGVCYLNLKDYPNAIEQLESYNPVNNLMEASSLSSTADAYAQQDNLDKALSLYNKAAKASPSEALTIAILKKVAALNETQGNKEAALAVYNRIKEDFPTSQEAKTIDKYIARLK